MHRILQLGRSEKTNSIDMQCNRILVAIAIEKVEVKCSNLSERLIQRVLLDAMSCVHAF
jgi:hypothetical protein